MCAPVKLANKMCLCHSVSFTKLLVKFAVLIHVTWSGTHQLVTAADCKTASSAGGQNPFKPSDRPGYMKMF